MALNPAPSACARRVARQSASCSRPASRSQLFRSGFDHRRYAQAHSATNLMVQAPDHEPARPSRPVPGPAHADLGSAHKNRTGDRAGWTADRPHQESDHKTLASVRINQASDREKHGSAHSNCGSDQSYQASALLNQEVDRGQDGFAHARLHSAASILISGGNKGNP